MARLVANAYGKSGVRVTRVTRQKDRHELHEFSVNVTLHGAFEKSYLTGDNSQIVATDTIKNTIYALAKTKGIVSAEGFGAALGEHFLSRNNHVEAVTAAIEQHTWVRINGSPIAFEGSSQEVRTAVVKTARAGAGLTTQVTAGLDGLLVLKTTDSAFGGFLRDEYTTLPEAADRIFATVVKAEWAYSRVPADVNGAFAKARAAMLEVFATHKSLAVQQTLFVMGEAVLAAVPEVSQITITMPNKHRIPANLKPLGLEFEHDVYVTTDEPYGDITGTVARD